jgi:hypothetical protein
MTSLSLPSWKPAFGILALCAACAANAGVVLQVSPSFATAGPGGTTTATISAINSQAGSVIGGFDLELRYDSALWALGDVQFSQFLGNLANFEAITSADSSVAGIVRLASVSLVGPFDPLPLSAIQPASGTPFTLATVSFAAIGSGVGTFRLASISVTDEFGAPLNAVPEPSMLALLIPGLLSIAAVRRRRPHPAAPQA